MTDTEQLFAELAETHLGIPTLKPRMSDALDFHTVAVWGVRAALTAAHRAGAATASQTNSTKENPGRFTGYEIHPCRRLRYDDEPDRAYVERCEPCEADFWTVFGLLADGRSMAVGDFATREHAEEILGRITGGIAASVARSRGGGMTMSDDLLDDLFHGCALEAFLRVARQRQDWPEPAETRALAGRLYEDALAAKQGRPQMQDTESRIGMPAEPATDPG